MTAEDRAKLILAKLKLETAIAMLILWSNKEGYDKCMEEISGQSNSSK